MMLSPGIIDSMVHRNALAILLFAISFQSLAQPTRVPVIRPAIRNLDFSEGEPGKTPPGWGPGPDYVMPPDYPYVLETAAGKECHSGQKCGTLKSIRDISPDNPNYNRSFLYQLIDAAPHRGRYLTFRAFVRAEVSLGNVARLIIRVHDSSGGTTFRYDMGELPIVSNEWASYEIRGPIAPNAHDIEFGLQLMGQGAAWIDNAVAEFSDTPMHPYEFLVRSIIHDFAVGRNTQDGTKVAALYAEDGEWIAIGGTNRLRGRDALARLWGSLKGHVDRTVQSVEFPGPNIAVVRAAAQNEPPNGLFHEVFVLVQEDHHWLIKVHQTLR
jgi:uncharacterized protein (TIGR02246 family)